MDISPFAALRYADTRAGEIDRSISLPYDQFGDAGRDERYRRHPHNVVRLIKPRPEDGATAHELAQRTLATWRRHGVLAADPAPAVYPYRQRFQPPGGDGEHERWAFISRLRLTPFASGPVKPHERTYPGTVGERSRLRELVGADLGLILVVYDDPGGDIDALVRQAANAEALLQATDEAGTANALWKWEQDKRVMELQRRLAAVGGFIADGHHRYTAALGHWQGGAAADDPAGWVMAAMVSAASSGLQILPTHRLTAKAPTEADLETWRRAGLEISHLVTSADIETVAAAARDALAEHAADHAVVYVHSGGGDVSAELVHAPRGSLSTAPWPGDVPRSWRGLDVPVLHSLLLDPWMAEVLRGQTEEHGALEYCNDYLGSVRTVAEGERAAAFLINPLSVAQVQGVVQAGDVLPPKSTNFFPKVVAGLTIHAFGDATGS